MKSTNNISIILVTELYPSNETQGPLEVSYALHNFIKKWVAYKNVNCKVLKLNRIRKNFHVLKAIEINKIDMVEVITYTSFKYSLKSKIARNKFLTIVKQLLFLIYNIRKIIYYNIVGKLRVYYILKKFNPDIVLSHMPNGLLFASNVNNRLKTIHVHGFHQSDVRHFSKINYVLNKVNAYAFRSPSIRRSIYNSLNSKDLKKDSFLALSGIPSADIISFEPIEEKWNQIKTYKLLVVCNHLPLKNIDITLRALSSIDPKYSWTFDIVGKGEETKKLKELTLELGLSNKVVFHGYKENAICLDMMQKSHIFVMVSSPETLGLVYLEAVAKGMMIIGSKNWGVDGLFTNEKEAFFCNSRDVDGLKHTIIKIFDMNNDTRLQMVKAAYVKILKLTQENTAKAYLDFISEVYQNSMHALKGKYHGS